MSDQTETSTQALAKASPDIFLLFDRADDARIIARIRGEAIKECVYAFPQGRDEHGKQKWLYGIGIDGAEECKRELAKRGEIIREDDIDIMSETPDEARFRAKASRWAVGLDGREVRLDTTVELKRQEKYITRRDGSQSPNEFWLEQGGSKAMRNAILNLTPQAIKQQIIDAFKQQATVVAPSQDQVEGDVHDYHRKMDAKDERDALVAEVKDLWRALGWTKAQVKACLRARDLSEALVEQHVSWATVDQAMITDLRDAMKKEAGR